MDALTFAVAPGMGVRLLWCDVTVATRALEARHLCGPAATQVLGEALACAALFSADLTLPESSVAVQVQVEGPIRGVVAEATQAGDLRGFTRIKLLEPFDGLGTWRMADLLGATGQAAVIKSVPGRILSRSVVPATPPELRAIAARYLNQSVQTPACVQLPVAVDNGGVIAAGGLVCELMPDGDRAAFFDLVERMNGVVAPLPGKGLDAGGVGAFLGITDLAVRDCRRLRFHCRCSRERVEAMLALLPVEELREMENDPGPRRVTCHMCGADYAMTLEEVRVALMRRG